MRGPYLVLKIEKVPIVFDLEFLQFQAIFVDYRRQVYVRIRLTIYRSIQFHSRITKGTKF